MSMQGDGREGQPGESVVSLDDIAELDTVEESALDDSGEGDESEESEEVEDEEVEDDEEESEEGSSESVKKKYTIKHDGKDVELELTDDEHAAMLQQSFDYTKKTMAVAEERKGVEAEKARASEVRQKYEQAVGEQVHRLQALDQMIASQIGNPPTADMIQTYGIEWYVAQKEAHEARVGQLGQVREALQRVQQEQARQRQAWVAEQAEATERELASTLPGWNEKTLDELIAYADKYGVGENVADTVLLQKGFWELAHKAKAYDALLAKKAEQKPVAKLAKVTPPKAGNQPSHLAKRQAAVKRYDANPSLNALADLL